MSECRHEWVSGHDGQGLTYCEKCGAYRENVLEQENADLRAKLGAAEKAKNELVEDLIIERRKSSEHSNESLAFQQRAWKAEQVTTELQQVIDSQKETNLVLLKKLEAQNKQFNSLESNSVKTIRKLQDELKRGERDDARRQASDIEAKVRKADMNSDSIPRFLQKQKDKPLDVVINNLAYRSDQYWTIVAILANYQMMQKNDENISDAVKRMVDLLESLQAANAMTRDALEEVLREGR